MVPLSEISVQTNVTFAAMSLDGMDTVRFYSGHWLSKLDSLLSRSSLRISSYSVLDRFWWVYLGESSQLVSEGCNYNASNSKGVNIITKISHSCPGICIRNPSDGSPHLFHKFYKYVFLCWPADRSWCPPCSGKSSRRVVVPNSICNPMGLASFSYPYNFLCASQSLVWSSTGEIGLCQKIFDATTATISWHWHKQDSRDDCGYESTRDRNICRDLLLGLLQVIRTSPYWDCLCGLLRTSFVRIQFCL